MNPSLVEQIHSLMNAIFGELFGETATVELTGESSLHNALWARVSINGAWSGDVWVGPSRLLAARISSQLFSAEAPDDSELEDSTCELANVVAGNLKALLPPPSSLGIPEFCGTEPELDAGSYVHFSVDGEGFEVAVREGARA